jgi:hypothetical protein
MSHHSFLPLIVTVGVLWMATLTGCASKATPTADRAAPAPASATIVSVEGASTVYQTRDWNGQLVTVRVPAQTLADIKGEDAKGNLRATVTAIDPRANRVQVQTVEGQRILLAMAPDARKDLQVGATVLITVPKVPR